MAIKSKIVPDIDRLEEGLRSGDRTMLAQAITLAESTLDSDRKRSEQLIEKLLPLTGKSIRIGITGVPGVGKSTFIETFGELLTREGRKVGVLTIDPSSEKSRGSILGDKTRMNRLSKNPSVFIRPSPTNLALGGVSHRTRECMLLCEAAGFDVILIETVGVGQSETQVRNMVDFFLLLLLSGAGDELQGIKKGIIEMADGLIVTKADGENIKAASQAMADARTALHLQASSPSGWKPRVQPVSSIENKGIAEVWKVILEFQNYTTTSGYFQEHRMEQKKKWLEESLENLFRDAIHEQSFMARKEKLIARIMSDSLAPSEAARKLWKSLGAD